MSSKQLQKDWLRQVLENLEKVEPGIAEYIRTRRVRIGFWKKGSHVGAFWAVGRRIYLNSRHYTTQTSPDDPGLLSILIHEVCHFRQGPFVALSVYGELQAWQLGFQTWQQLTGLPYHPNLVELMSLPLVFDRTILRRACTLMQLYASKRYRADLLPLYPWDRELRFWLGLGAV